MILKLLLASMVWGSNVLVSKMMLEYVPKFFLASIRLWLVCFLLFCLCIYYKQPIIKKSGTNLFRISFFSIVANFLLTFLALDYLSGTAIASLNGMLPIVTLLFLKQRWHRKYHSISLVCILCSIFFSLEVISIGYLYMFLSLVCSAIGCVYIQRNKQLVYYYSFTLQYQWIGAILLSFITFFLESNSTISFSNIPISLLFIFFIISGIGFCYIQVVYVQAIKTIGSVKASYVLGLNPIFTFLFSFILYPELSIMQLISFLFLGFSIYFGKKVSAKINEI